MDSLQRLTGLEVSLQTARQGQMLRPAVLLFNDCSVYFGRSRMAWSQLRMAETCFKYISSLRCYEYVGRCMQLNGLSHCEIDAIH